MAEWVIMNQEIEDNSAKLTQYQAHPIAFLGSWVVRHDQRVTTKWQNRIIMNSKNDQKIAKQMQHHTQTVEMESNRLSRLMGGKARS